MLLITPAIAYRPKPWCTTTFEEITFGHRVRQKCSQALTARGVDRSATPPRALHVKGGAHKCVPKQTNCHRNFATIGASSHKRVVLAVASVWPHTNSAYHKAHSVIMSVIRVRRDHFAAQSIEPSPHCKTNPRGLRRTPSTRRNPLLSRVAQSYSCVTH